MITNNPNQPDLMLLAIVQAQDAENTINALIKLNLSVTRLPSIGGFLGQRNVSLLIGLHHSQEDSALEALAHNCRQRIEYIAVPMESAPLPLPAPTPIPVGGATVFAFNVDHYEEL